MKAFKKELTMLGVMIALAILTAALNPSSFLDGDNLRNNVRHISLISLFALRRGDGDHRGRHRPVGRVDHLPHRR